MIVRDEVAEFAEQLRLAWDHVSIDQSGTIQPGSLFGELQSAAYRIVVQRGTRVAAMLSETLRTLKVPYEESLSVELAALLDPLFPEDLHLAALLNAPDVLKRRGLPVNLDERSFDRVAVTAQGAIANASREARTKVQLVIDEYLLSIKPTDLPPQGWLRRVWNALSLRLSFYGIGIDFKKLFSHKPSAS
jgi:hypothetical protein